MTKKETILDIFYNWMDDNKLPRDSEGSRKSYKSYISAAYDNVSALVKSGKCDQEISDSFNSLPFDNKDKFIELLTLFANSRDLLYTLTVYDKMYDLLCKVIESTGDKKLQKRHSAFVLFKEFLYKYDKYVFQSWNLSNVGVVDEKRLNEARGLFVKDDLHVLDGMESLLTILKDDNEFVKLAVENSYFFAPKIVEEQVQEHLDGNGMDKARHTSKQAINVNKVAKPLKKEDDVIARYEFPYDKLKDKIYLETDNPVVFDVHIDRDGNKYVRSLIEEKTGIVISQGEKNLIQNTIISHVWGRAYDPRFFTSLWNIVLIPAWANSLMDKNPVARTLASKMQATYMEICHKLNENIFNNTCYWKKLNLNKPGVLHHKDIVHFNYSINVANYRNNECVAISKVNQKV